MPFDNRMVMTGNANPKLAQKVSRHPRVWLRAAVMLALSGGLSTTFIVLL